MSKKGEPLGKNLRRLTLVDVFKNRYSEANNTVGSAARLRLVVGKSHRRQIDKKLRRWNHRKTSPTCAPDQRCHSDPSFQQRPDCFLESGAQKLMVGPRKGCGEARLQSSSDETPGAAPGRGNPKLRRHGCWTGELVQTRKRRAKNCGCELLVAAPEPERSPTEILEVNYNVTDRKQSSHRGTETERLALVGTMAAVFAHEVANP